MEVTVIGYPDIVTTLANLALYMSMQLFFGVVAFWRRNIIAIVATIVSSIAVMPMLADNVGLWTLAPLLILVIGAALMLLRDAWERRVEL